MKPVGKTGQRKAYFTALANELEAFLVGLQKSDPDMISFIEDRVAYLNNPKVKLTDDAKAILLQSDYAVVQEIMSYRKSTAVRWVCIWVV
jgi:hypothetical protein